MLVSYIILALFTDTLFRFSVSDLSCQKVFRIDKCPNQNYIIAIKKRSSCDADL